MRYTKSLSSPLYAPITIDEERKLFIFYREGSEVAFKKLINSNLRFVPFLIKKDFHIPDDIDIMDIIQEGNLGLIEGVQRFKNEEFNCRVYSYCAYWIYFYVNRYLGSTQKMRKMFFTYDDTDEELKDIILTDDSACYHALVNKKACEDITNVYLKDLPAKERCILIDYYGLKAPFTPKTLQEIGSMYHINLERVRQLKNGALNKLQQQNIRKDY